VAAAQKARAVPAVLQFDAAGKCVQAWGGPGPGYDWPDMEHGVSVDRHRRSLEQATKKSGSDAEAAGLQDVFRAANRKSQLTPH